MTQAKQVNVDNIKTMEDVRSIFRALNISLNIDNEEPHIQQAIYLTEPTKENNVEQETKNPIMKYFEYKHLPEKLQKISKPICDLAIQMEQELPDSIEKDVGLRKLLEAKDALVRASI